MEFDKINAFLATAIGGLIFKWLAGGVSSLWSWLNKTHPEEDFLVSNMGIVKPLIRLSLCRYKLSTKPHSKYNKVFTFMLGAIICSISIVGLYHFTNTVTRGPIQWIDYTHKETKDSFWIKQEEARNRPNTPHWRISPDTCANRRALDTITSINLETKEFICGYLTDPIKKDELSKATNKNFIGMIILITVFYLSSLFFIMLGVSMFIDLYINKKITKYNKSEIEKSYQYLT